MTKEELDKKHSLYKTYYDDWLYYMRSYYGGRRYREGNYLLRHPFESEANYKRRKDIAYFYNYCAPIIDIYVSYLTKIQPQRSYGQLSSEAVPPRKPKTPFDRFWMDCDLEGTRYDHFIREALRQAAIYGRISILVDRPESTAKSKAQEIEFGLHPYLTIVRPEDLLDWKYERASNGRYELSMAKIREDENTYRIWNRNGWELWFRKKNTATASLLAVGEHGLGRIPLVNLYNKKSDTRMVGISDIEDIADINKNIYYFCSDAKEIIENTAFPMLAAPYEKGASGNEQSVGPKNVWQFDPDNANAKPFWLEPPHSSLTEIREWIQQDAQEIVRIAKMGGMRNVETSVQPWSNVAIETQERQLHAALAEKASNAEQAELDILELYALWEGSEFEGDVVYPRDFAIRDLTTTLQNAVMAGTAGIMSEKFERERQKKIVVSAIPDMEEALRDDIFVEIDGATISLPTGVADRSNGATTTPSSMPQVMGEGDQNGTES